MLEFLAKGALVLTVGVATALTLQPMPAQANPIVASSTNPTVLAPRFRADCTDVLVLGARGSGQPQAGSTSDGGTGLGPQVASVASRVVTDLPGRTVGVRSLRYPARQAELLVLDPATYFNGLERGVATAKKALARQVVACPKQRFVIAGYSQGAMVMHRVLQDLSKASDSLSKRILRRVDGAVLLADGDRLSSDRMTSLGSAGAGRGVSYASPQDSNVRGTRLPARLAPRVFSVCEQADVICDYRSLFQTSSSGVDGTTVHVASYTGSPNVLQAADAAAARVR
jgi:hypothetical protein